MRALNQPVYNDVYTTSLRMCELSQVSPPSTVLQRTPYFCMGDLS